MLRRLFLTAAMGVACVSPPSIAQTYLRMEMRAVESVTLTGEQFLTGSGNGKPVTLAGELRLPRPGTDRLPAVILVHGSGGVGALQEWWAQEINSLGVATFTLDAFSGRGIVHTIDDQSQVNSLAMMVDTYRALAILARHSRIDPDRIAVMGFSKGAVAAVYSSNERFRRLYGPPNVQFAAHIGMYTPCGVRYDGDEKTTGKPIRLYHGIADDWVAIEPCRAYVARLSKAGADVALTEYPDAYHAYDSLTVTQPIKFPQAQTTRHCWLDEGRNGEILNSKSGKRFDFDDPCVEKGTQVAYNAAAHQATLKSVKDFLITVFSIR